MMCLACLMVLLGSAWAQQSTDTASKLDRLRLEMSDLQTRLDQELQKKDEVSAQLAQIEQDLNTLRKKIRDNERSRLETKKSQLELRAQLDELSGSAEQLMGDLGLLLLRGYPIKKHSTLELVLNQQNPQRTAKLLAYHQLLTQSSVSTLESLSAQIAQINAIEEQLINQSTALESLIAEQELRLIDAAALVERRHEMLASIDQQIGQSTSALERLQQDEASLAQVLELAEQQPLDKLTAAEPPNVLSMKGQLPMPVRGDIRQRYGQRRDGGHTWRGWVLETSSRAPVHAIASGRVVYANWLRGYGLLTIIDHQDEVLSLYAHNDTLFFEVGDWVRQGEQIATAGEPRYDRQISPYGMYFELREDGRPTDPAAWLDPSRIP